MTSLKSTINYCVQHRLPIYPLAPKSTIPLAGSHGFKDANCEPETVSKAFSAEDNIALALQPLHWLVFDVDVNHESGFDGIQSYKQLIHDYNAVPLPTDTLVIKTPHGGLHYVLSYPAGMNIPNKALAEISPELAQYTGIDICTYSTPLPPTKTQDGKYIALTGSLSSVQAASKWLLELVTCHPKPKYHKTIYKKWTGQLLDSLFAEYETGNRNNSFTRLAGKLFRTGADPENIYQLLEFANSQQANPLPDKELNAIFRSIMKREYQGGAVVVNGKGN